MMKKYWRGHKYYAAAVAELLDENTLPFEEYAIHPHTLPQALDDSNYESGHLLPVQEASRLKGFSIVEDWTPDDDVSTRRGFVHIPALVTDKGGSFSLEVDGIAVGIYCVCGRTSHTAPQSAARRKVRMRH